MLVLPAIDLMDGKVVRLAMGDYGRRTVYSDDPAGVVGEFVRAGARWIHVVDLDAAKAGRPINVAAVQAIRKAVDARIELGGGARNETAVRSMLGSGADRVVVGSAALANWSWFEGLLADKVLAGTLALGLDARGGRLAVHGWVERVDATPVEVARRVTGSGLAAIVYTDISRDGMLAGVDLEGTAELVSATDVPIIASGGLCSVRDVHMCRGIGCAGVIVGRAYYEGRIDLAEAIAEAGPQAS